MDVLRPYLLLACVAFFVGFASYLAAAGMLAPTQVLLEAPQAPITASAPEAPLAAAKHI